MDQYIGKLLDNRYEILELVGVGGMARVYKARCHRLNRLVAIKILREDLSQDSELRRRFHDESQAVAMLSHPNIVSVYDVSRSSELEYIVMELIDGITLKQYMEKKGNKLNWREALHFITQIVKALGHAHSRGIIHRDIKPHNVMVLRDGSVKVADFGIARLVTGGHSTLTQEALGSVHYISPEQARGSHIDARSDLYSAGVVLYEMITGRLPFEGDTPVSVAIQHINSIPLSPRELDPSIPEALEAITMKAMAPNPDNRYSSADEMLADLEEFRKNPSINFDYNVADFLSEKDDIHDDDKTRVRTVLPTHVRDSRSDYTRVSDSSHTHAHRYPNDDADAAADEESGRSGKSSPGPIIAAVAAILIFIAGVFYLLYQTVLSGMFAPPPADIHVPNLVGSLYEDVKDNKNLLGDFQIVLGESEYHDSAEPGTIIRQEPKADTKADPETTKITVFISSGPEPVLMIDLLDMDYLDAFLALSDLNLGLKYTTEYEYHDTIEKNHVISFTPYENTPLAPGDEIQLVISKGPKVELVPLPNLIGLTQEKAESDIRTIKMAVGSVEAVFSESPAGVIVYQYPAAGTQVEEGTSINLQVSKGPDSGSVETKKVTKNIDIDLPVTDDMVSLVVMMDGDVIFKADYDPTMDTSVSVPITGEAGTTKTVTYFINGVMGDTITVEFNP